MQKISQLATQNRKYLSYILIILSCTTWVTGYLYSNQHNLHPIETSILRGFMIMIGSFIMCRINNQNICIYPSFKYIMIRNTIFLVQAFAIAWVQFYLPLSVVHTIGSTGPLYVSLFQYFLEGKKITKGQGIGMAVIIAGTLLTANGRILSQWFDKDYSFSTDFSHYKSQNSVTLILASFILLSLYIVWGYGVYITNRIKASAFQVNFIFGMELFFISSLLYPLLLKNNNENIDASTFYWGILFGGILLAIAEISFVCGIMLAENIGVAIMLGSCTILIAYLCSIFRYQQQINFFCLLGSVILVLGLSKILFTE